MSKLIYPAFFFALIAIVGCEKEITVESNHMEQTTDVNPLGKGLNQNTFELLEYEEIDDLPLSLTSDMENVKNLFRYSEIGLVDFYMGTWAVNGINMSCRMAVLKSNTVEANTYLLYDQYNQNPPMIVDVQMNRSGEVKLCRYYNSEGVLLASAIASSPGSFAFTYVNTNYDGTPAEMGFLDCINSCLSDPLIQTVGLAAAMTGAGGAVAAGIVIGCGIGSIL